MTLSHPIRPELKINAGAGHGAEAAWQFFDAFAPILRGDMADRTDNRTFRTELTGVQLGPMVLSRVMMAGGDYSYERDSRLIAASGLDLVFVQIIIEGSDTRLVNGCEVQSQPGDVFIADLTRTMRTRTGQCTNFSFLLPRAAFGLKDAEIDRLHDRHLPAGSTAARLILSHVKALWDERCLIGEAETMALASATGGLIAGFVNEATFRGDALAPGSKYLQICQYIDQNLAHSELGPDMLASRFNLSRAALYRVFADTDGVANYIRDRRLRHAFRRLMSERRPNVSAIGFASGFGNVSSFIRAFKARYGITPGDAIENAARRGQDATVEMPTSQGSLLRSWIEYSDRIATLT